jgi:anti-sigma B factor antagonist
MQIMRNELAGHPLLQVMGDLDHLAAPALATAIDAAITPTPRCVLLDLESCSYIDSGGIGVLVHAVRRVRPDAWLGVVGANVDIVRLLNLVGLTIDPSFRVFEGLEEANAALLDAADSTWRTRVFVARAIT